MSDAPDRKLLKFLKELMEIQRRYANELRGVKTNRQEEVRELLEKYAKEGSDAD